MNTATKVRENRLRETAKRRGFVLHRIRRKDPQALDHGAYVLMEGNRVVFGASMKIFGHNFRPEDVATLDEIGAFLDAQPAARSGVTIPDPTTETGYREVVSRRGDR